MYTRCEGNEEDESRSSAAKASDTGRSAGMKDEAAMSLEDEEAIVSTEVLAATGTSAYTRGAVA
jgi:hypothetical protein